MLLLLMIQLPMMMMYQVEEQESARASIVPSSVTVTAYLISYSYFS
jgi:hypothetical protein